MKYPHNVLDGFANGCLTDYRVRIALNLLATSTLFEHALPVATEEELKGVPASVAKLALDVADELMTQAEARGWVEPLPGDGEGLSPDMRMQARRAGAFQAQQQLGAQAAAAEEQGRVAVATPAPGRIFNQ